MTKIKKGIFIILFFIILGARFHHYDSIMVKAEEIEATIEIVDQKSVIEEHTIQITIEEEEPRTVQLFIEKEEIKEEPKIEKVQSQQIISYNQYANIINSLSLYDRELICKITFLEAGNQCIEGQRAVIEVILNRVASPQWPNTVEGVLSAPRQFSTWKKKDSVSVEHIAQMNNVLNLVASSNDTILPNINYVYFNNKNGNSNSIKIQNHWFWT